MLLVCGMLFTCAFLAQAAELDTFMQRTFFVLPNTITSDTWENLPALQSQDYDEEALYQNFKASGSAYIERAPDLGDAEETELPSSPNTSTETDVEASTTPSVTPLIPDELNAPEEIKEEVEPIIEPLPEEEAVEPVEPEPESAPDAAEESSAWLPRLPHLATGGLSALFRSVHEYLPLAVETWETETATDSASMNGVVAEVEPSEATLDVDVPIVEDVATSSLSSTGEESGEVAKPVAPFCGGAPLCRRYTLEFGDFSVPPLEVNESIENAQIRLSLAGKPHAETAQGIVIEYSFGDAWFEAGEIDLSEEVSNALNGGYFLFALPSIATTDDVERMHVRLSYYGDPEALEQLYVDSLWLELHALVIDEDTLRARAEAGALPLEAPTLHEFIGSEIDFTLEEMPHFTLKYKEQRNFIIRFFRSLFADRVADVAHVALIHADIEDVGVTPEINMTEDGLWTIQIPERDRERLRPGRYTIEITVNEGAVAFTDSFEFQWGLLALNSDKSDYRVGESAQLSFAALSPNGNTLCEANLAAYVIRPDHLVELLTVERSGLCNGNNVVLVPDYLAQYQTSVVGQHTMYLERFDERGEVVGHTEDTFVVASSSPISIARSAPTRIYPVSGYPVELSVTTRDSFSGELTETLPKDFEVTDTDAVITEDGESKILTWPIVAEPGTTQTFAYTFDAPDISPYLYMIGKATVRVDESTYEAHPDPELPILETVVEDETSDAISDTSGSSAREDGSDDPGSLTVPEESTDGEGGVPEVLEQQEEPVTDPGGVTELEPADAPLEEPVMPQEAEPTGSPGTEEPVVPQETAPSGPPTPEEPAPAEPETDGSAPISFFQRAIILPLMLGEEVIEELSSDTTTPDVVLPEVVEETEETLSDALPTASTTASAPEMEEPSGHSYTESRKWQIASDATGSMIVYWSGTTTPSGWTCVSCLTSDVFYQKFARGSTTYSGSSNYGVSTSTHTASGTVYTSSSANGENDTGSDINTSSHTHTLTPNVLATSTLPLYRQLRVLQNNSAGEPASLPAGVVLMFDAAPPTGWTIYSAQNGYYVRGENTVGSTSGANTHKHEVYGTTSAAAGSVVNSRTGGSQVTSSAVSHTHDVNASTTATNHEPPYREAIFATSSAATSTPVGAITMWTDTPPAAWVDQSAVSGDPFFERFFKASTTAGGSGGASTHTHSDVTSVTSKASTQTDNARSGSTGSASTHTHLVDITNFSTQSHLPPYVDVIVAKRLVAVATYTQSAFQWFVNTNGETPTDKWPEGASDLGQNETLTATTTPVAYDEVIRLRLGISNAVATATAETFKLQFGSTTSSCGSISSWTDVGSATSSAEWRGYDNASTTDGTTLSSSTLSGTDRRETYEEQNPTATMPNDIGPGEDGEWDFVLQHHSPYPAATYCFRLVESDGTALYSYGAYPTVYTNDTPTMTLSKLFDNEAVATTTPTFFFFASDPEGDTVDYQIQVDNDYSFGSTVVDLNSESSLLFENLAFPANRSPFNNAETIFVRPTTELSSGTTYYWRVRSKDTGSTAWGDWSTIRSFTASTTLAATAWFQTETDQFNTNTNIGIDTASDQMSLAVGSTTGTSTSGAIDFADASSGNAWGSLSFSSTNVRYFIEYESAGTWALIPDSALAGNSTGFTSSPVNLLGLDTDTYPTIRIAARFSGASPTLSDWTLSWGYRIDTPTTEALFPNEKVATTTPTFEFYTDDPQGDSLIWEFQWATSSTFATSTTRLSSTTTFVNIDTATDTSPFNSGDTIQFTIPGSVALTDNTTYWWRVRAVDPFGSDSFSFYTDPQSFTVASTVVASTWFQTTGEQFDADTLSGIVSVSGIAASVATTADESLLVYGEGTAALPRYREWNGSVWGDESTLATVGVVPTWVVTKASPTREEYVSVTMGSDGDVNAQVFAGGSWGDEIELTTAAADTDMRAFDVAYERSSGDAMVAYCDGDADPSYYIWNGSTWTSGGTINLTSTNNCGWIKLIADPTADEIIVVSNDISGSSYEAQVWNGSAWGNSTTLGSMLEPTHEGIAAAYEESGNQAVVAVSNGNFNRFTWTAWNGTTWSAPATQALTGDFEWGSLVADQGSDAMALCYVDDGTNIGVVRWTGSAWTGQVDLDVTSTKESRPVDCAFETTAGRDGYIMVTYSDATGLRYQSWNGSAWSGEASVSTIADVTVVDAERLGDGKVQIIALDDGNDRYDSSYWNGSSWSTFETLETDASVGAAPYKQPFSIAARSAGTTGSIRGAPGIDFYDGSGPYWQQLSWNDTESGGSSILYQVEYYNTASSTWDLVPNSLIPGNSSGTTTSPIDLTSVLPVATYSELRPVGNFTCNVGTCPLLNDWTLTWAEGITIAGTAQDYDQSTNLTSGTVAVALNGVIQTGKTGTIAGGNWSIANVNASQGDVITVFISSAADSGEAVGVTVYDGIGNVSGINLYARHLSLGSDDLATTTNAMIGLYDFSSTEDIFANVDGSNDLTVCATTGCEDAELYIKAGNKYQPGADGDVSTHDIENNGTFLPNGNTIRISGSWDNNATSTMATSTLIFTATSTTESVDDTGAVAVTYNNVTFGETSGSATWNLSSNLDIDGNLSTAFGTLARSSRTLNVAGNITNGASGLWTGTGTTTFDGASAAVWTDSAATKQNIGKVVVDGSSKTVTLGSDVKAQSVTIGADDIFDVTTSGYDIEVLGNWTNSNTFLARTGIVTFSGTSTNQVINAGASSFYDLTFSGGGGSWSFTQTSLTVGNDFTVSTGTVNLPTGTTTVTGSWNSTGGLFAHSNGGVTFNSAASETITLAGSNFTNTFYKLAFTGSGSWSFGSGNATTSDDMTITGGTVTLPTGVFALGGSLLRSGGTFSGGSGTLQLTSSGTETLQTGGGSYYSLLFTGGGAWSFVDASPTASGNVTITSGTVTLPTGTFTVTGSFTNSATFSAGSGTVLMNATTTGKTINPGNSSFNIVTLNSATGGWTVTANATTTGAFSLTAAGAFTQNASTYLSVGGTFTNAVGGASTTWSGTLALVSGTSYTMNSKTTGGDVYGTLIVGTNTDLSMWNSSASTYTVHPGGSLYSQDHAGVDGDLNIYGAYERTSGTEYWSYATDFDGTALGGSSRQVDVRFASGASASLSGATLSVVGSAGSTTTVDAISGTYAVTVGGGTTTASYYSFTGMSSSGLTLASSTVVTTLAEGQFTVTTPGGTALSVSSSTIDLNPGLQIFHVDFATTTAIAATNVTQTDGTPSSYWWFRESSGNLDGEGADNDTGDPGSIRWDNSNLLITVAGNIYSDEGITPLGAPTCDGATPVVRVVVNGTASSTGTCSAGVFSIPNVAVNGDPVLTVYLDTNGGVRATTITKTPTADITDLRLYANRIMTRHESASPLTTSDMAYFDETHDDDIRFDAATGTTPTLTVRSDTGLTVSSSTTFAPGGPITLESGGTGNSWDGTLHVDNGATFTGAGTTTYTIGGRFAVDNSATFTSASSTVVMTATTTGKNVMTPDPQVISFHNLTFSGTGEWTVDADIAVAGTLAVNAGTVLGAGDINVTGTSFSGNGTVAMTAGTTTLARGGTLGGTQPWSFYDLTLGNGSTNATTTPAGTATTTVGRLLTIRSGHELDANASQWDLAGGGTPFSISGIFTYDTSTVRYSRAAATNITSTSYYHLDVNATSTATHTAIGSGINVYGNLMVGSSGATTFTLDTSDPALNVEGSVLIGSSGTLVGSNSGSFTVADDWRNSGTFTPSGGTVTFDGAGTTDIYAGNSSFATALISNAAGTFNIKEHATATAAFTLTAATAFTVDPSLTLAVGGTFTNAIGGAATTWTNSTLSLYGGGNYQINAKTISDTYGTLRVESGTAIRMWNSNAATTTVATSGSLYSQDHASVDGALYIYGNYAKASGSDYWSYATDFDGTALGGSSRAVTVSFAPNATATVSGGTLTIQGDSAASTTITNQGSGSYAFIVNAGTLSAQYYALRNMNANGLVITNAPTISTLSNGDIEVSVVGGSGITVGGTAIDQNPAKTFSENRFATSSGSIIPAYNVTATGTSISSWRFTNHYGDLAGEAYNVDPDGDPGYIVWDDSLGDITISGTVYSDEGSTPIGGPTCDGFTQNVHLRVSSTTSYTTSCSAASSTFSIPNVAYSVGESMTLYLDTGGGAQAANVTVDPVSSIANMHLYQDRVIVRHENTDPITIDELATWDSDNDSDIPFNATSSSPDTLYLPSSKKLIVWTGKTFAPGGNIDISGHGNGASYDGSLELYTNAVFTAAGTESHIVAGSLVSGAGASITGAQATWTFTTSGAARTVDTNNGTLYNMTFNGTGSWAMGDTDLTVSNNFTITAGAVTLPSATTTIAGSFQNTGGSFTHSSGVLYFTATASGKSIAVGTSSVNQFQFNGSGGGWTFTSANATSTNDFLIQAGAVTLPSGTLAIGGQFNTTGGSFTHNSGILKLSSATASTTIRGNGSNFGSITIAGAGPFIMQDTSPTLAGTLNITTGSISLATGTLSIGGSLLATGGTFTHSTGTILFNSSDTGETINPGTSTFNNVSLASAGGGWTISANATTTGNFSLTSASQFTMASGTKLTVYGVFTNTVGGSATTWSSSTLAIETGTNYSINSSASNGDVYHNLTIGADTDIRMWKSGASSTLSVATSSSLYSQDHANQDGILYIYGDYLRTSGSDYWSYATDFDGTALGGSSRAVAVYFDANATGTWSGASLAMVGVSTATTTVQNQGSGTYAFVIEDSTLNAQYYAVRNGDVDGLQLSGVTTITSLSYGDFELATAGGSLITLASSTLAANSGSTYSSLRFATTSAITGTNIKLVDSTPALWTLTSHTGNLAGEAYDDDGGDDCGSLRWDDSSCLITEQTHYRWRNDDGGEGVPDSEWYDEDWTKRKRIAITNADATGYVNAVVKVPVTFDSDMQADFDDLRFTDSSGTTTISHWRETYTGSSDAIVWVKVPLLATSSVTNVYMYYGNGGVSDGSVGTTTFTTFDAFEDNNISEYSGQTSLFSVDTSSVFERTYRLEASDINGRTTDGIYNRTTATTSQGSVIRWLQYIDTTGTSDGACTLFSVRSDVNQNYAVCLQQVGVDRVDLARDVDDDSSSGTVFGSTTITYSTGWYEVEVRWNTSGLMDVSVVRNGSTVATTSGTDSNYSSGGIGFSYWLQKGAWDAYSVRPLLTTEPSVSISVEQVSGGASWYAAKDASASGITAGTTKRLRFVIENSGLGISAQQFRLDYAPKGNAASCEAVAYGEYAEVPDQGSCGTSPVCMTASTEFSNQASTTDLVLGDGEFIPGQIIEDPSNKTASSSIPSNYFSEIEYSLAPTSYATGTAYCLRATNDGSDLDAYSKVAELGLRFDPTVLSWSLNGGQDIALDFGTTTRIYATGTVSDANGPLDFQYATATIYRSGVGPSCTADNNNCYQIASTSCEISGCSGNTCDVSCYADIYFFADPTDNGTYIAQDWRADLLIADMSDGHDTQSTFGSEMQTLRALEVDSAIAFESVSANSDTGGANATTTISNIGNDSIDVNISGTDLVSGASSIPVANEKFATSTFDYSLCTYCTANSIAGSDYEVDLSKPTSTIPVISDEIYWGISIPFGAAAAAHEGYNTFMAVGD